MATFTSGLVEMFLAKILDSSIYRAHSEHSEHRSSNFELQRDKPAAKN